MTRLRCSYGLSLFASQFRNTSLDDATVSNSSSAVPPPTKLQKEFTSYLSIASNVPNAVFVILHALLGHLVGMRLRVLGSQVQAEYFWSKSKITQAHSLRLTGIHCHCPLTFATSRGTPQHHFSSAQ